MYFERLKTLGDFPIITKTYPNEREALIEISKRAPRNEVARFILSDLDKAIEMMQNIAPSGGKNRLSKDWRYPSQVKGCTLRRLMAEEF